MRENERRPARFEGHATEHIPQCTHVVAVHFSDGVAERTELVGQRLQRQDLLRGPGDLQPVPVDDGGEIIEAVTHRGQRSLPHRALIEFAIAHEHEDAVCAAVQPAGQRHARRDRQPVTQRAGVLLNAGHAAGRVADER